MTRQHKTQTLFCNKFFRGNLCGVNVFEYDSNVFYSDCHCDFLQLYSPILVAHLHKIASNSAENAYSHKLSDSMQRNRAFLAAAWTVSVQSNNPKSLFKWRNLLLCTQFSTTSDFLFRREKKSSTYPFFYHFAFMDGVGMPSHFWIFISYLNSFSFCLLAHRLYLFWPKKDPSFVMRKEEKKTIFKLRWIVGKI